MWLQLWSAVAAAMLAVVVKPSASLILQLGAIDATGEGAIDDEEVCLSTCRALSLTPLDDGDFSLGEPHLQNIRGERFDILRESTVEFLRYPPRKAENMSRNGQLHVKASIESEGTSNESKCEGNFFIRKLWIMGALVGKDLQISTTGMDPEEPNVLGIKIGSRTNLNGNDIDDFFSKEKYNMTFSDMRINNEKHHEHNRVTFASLLLDLGKVQLEIYWNTGKRLPNRIGFRASHLMNLGKHWGGILGWDDHTSFARYEPHCKKSTDLGHKADFKMIRDPEPMWASASYK